MLRKTAKNIVIYFKSIRDVLETLALTKPDRCSPAHKLWGNTQTVNVTEARYETFSYEIHYLSHINKQDVCRSAER